jgi:hypothetical protein
MLGAYEREEGAVSSRFGSQIVNRDPDYVGDGQNYFFAAPVNTITRLKYNSATWRYAGSGGGLYRRTGDTQGPYTLIASGLSGSPFGSISTNCFASSQPYLFIADASRMLKDSGTGTPTQWGITPPNQPANATEYAPKILMIDNFTNFSGYYTTTNTNGWSAITIGTVSATNSFTINNFQSYYGITGFLAAFNGAIAFDQNNVESLLFNIYGAPNPDQISGYGISSALPVGADTFTMDGYQTGTIAASTTATIGATINLDLSQNYQVTDDDLICFAMNLSDPAGISQINIMFDINNSGYTSSYYQKSVSPAYYQSGVNNSTDAYTTTSNEILALTLGVVTGDTSSTFQQQENSIVSQLQSSQANTGQDAWSTIYSRRGDFLPVGNAGNAGFDWASVTGWQIQVITTTNSSVTLSCNGLYLQWGAGPSSFGGVGYDYRWTYFNANTQTESNPSQEQYFSQMYGYPASYLAPIVLRQAFNVTGAYSSDPQVTHIRLYRRGGYMNTNWFYLDQIPNVTAGGTFSYKDIISDAALLQSNVLNLANDAPITSSLQNPIVTTLVNATVSPGTSPYSLFAPQTVLTAQQATYLPNQLVVVGTPQNLEQVSVVTGGVGTFSAVFRLTHAAGEQVQVFSIPQQPCDLVELAYGQVWVAGDPNNPHFLYYSNPGYPENFSPQNYIPVGSPSSPIMAVINFRGTLMVATLTTWYQIVNGNPPYAQPTGSTHGLVSKTGWVEAEGSVWYWAVDGIRDFRGSDGAFRSLPLNFIFQGIDQTPLPLADNTQMGTRTMGFLNNTVFASYQSTTGTFNRLVYSTDYCVPDDAEAMTRSGWKRRIDLEVGEEILAYDNDSETCKWTPIENINVFDYSGDLVRLVAGRHGHKLDARCTPNHSWWWRGESGKGKTWHRQKARLRPINDIGTFGDLLLASPLDAQEKRSLLTPVEAAILGWIVTDGSITTNNGAKRRRSARIYQKAGRVECDEIRALTAAFCTSETEYTPAYGAVGRNGKRSNPCLMVRFLLSTDFVEGLLEKCGFESRSDLVRIVAQLDFESVSAMYHAMLHADGHEGRQTWFCGNDNRVLSAFQVLATLYGKMTAFTAVYEYGIRRVSALVNPSVDCERINRSASAYSGKVWCPTTKYGSWVMRQNETVCITGNSRWRNDDVPATAMFLEKDTNVLLYAKYINSGSQAGYAIVQDQVGDYDDGGWDNGVLVQTPINMNLQMPYEDLGAPHFPKNWNTVEIDANTNGQTMNVLLNFDDGIPQLNLGTINTTYRQKIQLKVNAGEGQESYKCSPEITAAVTVAPILYQMNIYAAVLAANRTSLDTYWIKFGTDESKICKECYFDYTSTETMTVSLYADGATAPYFTFTLPQQPNRAVIRVRFPALKFRTFRMVSLNTAAMQMWASPKLRYKPVLAQSGYSNFEVVT